MEAVAAGARECMAPPGEPNIRALQEVAAGAREGCDWALSSLLDF